MVYVLCFDGSMVRAELCAQKRREKAFAKVLSNRYDDSILRTTFLYIAVSRAVQPIGQITSEEPSASLGKLLCYVVYT